MRVYQGERSELEDYLKREFCYVPNDNFIDNDLLDIKLLVMDTSIYRRSWPGSPTNKTPKAYLSKNNNDPSKKQNFKDSDAEQ